MHELLLHRCSLHSCNRCARAGLARHKRSILTFPADLAGIGSLARSLAQATNFAEVAFGEPGPTLEPGNQSTPKETATTTEARADCIGRWSWTSADSSYVHCHLFCAIAVLKKKRTTVRDNEPIYASKLYGSKCFTTPRVFFSLIRVHRVQVHEHMRASSMSSQGI